MPISLRFEGGAQLAKAIRALPQNVQGRVLVDGLTEAAEPMRETMARLAPREPGAPDIAENIVISRVTKIEGDRLTETEAAVAVGPAKGFFYGLFLEFGTVKMRARPFVRPAFDQEVAGALSQLGGILWRALSGRGAGPSRSTSGTGTL